MKFALFKCGGCQREYDSHIEEGGFKACPKCGQFNPPSKESKAITGRCDKCGKPLESTGHEWWHDQFMECTNGGKK